MSAVHDDDERLLARIGYKQVRKALPTGAVLRLIIFITGTEARILKMVNCLLCYFYSGGLGLCSSDIWGPAGRRGSRNCSLVLVPGLCHGVLHW